MLKPSNFMQRQYFISKNSNQKVAGSKIKQLLSAWGPAFGSQESHAPELGKSGWRAVHLKGIWGAG